MKTLTLYPHETISSKCSESASKDRPSNTRWRTSKAGCTSRVRRVTAPSAPSPTTTPSKSASPLENCSSSPPEVTSCTAATAVARFPFRTPEPCVAVATAPATEMCGSEARLCSATPSSPSRSTSSPYFRPAPKETVCASWSTTTPAGSASSECSASSEISSVASAMAVKECREPSTCTLAAPATMSWSCSRLDGRCRASAR